MEPGPELPDIKHSLIQPLGISSTTIVVADVQGSTTVALPVFLGSQTCATFSVKTRWEWAGLGKLLAQVVIPRFQEKAKQNRCAARFAAMLNLFSHWTLPLEAKWLGHFAGQFDLPRYGIDIYYLKIGDRSISRNNGDLILT